MQTYKNMKKALKHTKQFENMFKSIAQIKTASKHIQNIETHWKHVKHRNSMKNKTDMKQHWKT